MKTQFGRMTLFQVVEWADDLANIRLACSHALQTVKDFDLYGEHPYAKRLEQMKGSTLSLAKVASLKDCWQKWTHKDGATLSMVQGFLTDSKVVAMLN